MACSAIDPADEAPAPPGPDRESWGTRLEVRGRQSTVVITAPYVQDYLEGQVARADSGVVIDFHGRDGRRSTRVRAGRLTLSYDSQLVGVADCVRVQVGDSVLVTADTLVWHPDEDVLTIPGPLRLEQPQGWTEGRNLRTEPGLARWSVQEPQTRWRGRGRGAPADLEASGRLVGVHSDSGYVTAAYDSFRARFEGRSLRSFAARYTDVGGGRVLLSGSVSAVDSSWSLKADALDYDLGERALRASGHVELGDGDLRLEAGVLVEQAGGERWEAEGNPAVVTHRDVSVESRRIAFARATESVAAAPARLRQGDRLLQADSLVYDRTAGVARAAGGVSLSAPAFAGEAAAEWAEFDPGEGRAILAGAPSLSRSRGGQRVAISADTLHLDLEGRVLRGAPGFAVSASPVSVRSWRGVYLGGDDLAHLAGQVVLLQSSGEGARLAADSMVVHLLGEAISRVEVPGALAGTVGHRATQVTWLAADAAVIELSDGRLTAIELNGEAEATHREARRGRASRFRARDMTLLFGEGGELRFVQARGGAEVSAVLPAQRQEEAADGLTGTPGDVAEDAGGSAYNRVEGEALEIALERGKVVEVRVLESIEGRFLPAAEDGPEGESPPGD